MPAAHLLHNSQEQGPRPFTSAEKAIWLPAFDVGDGIDGIFDETCGLGYSADADAFLNALDRTGPGVEVREGVSKSL